MIRRQLYGWFDQRRMTFRTSPYPPDAPVRPSTEYPTKAAVMEMARKKRANIMWIPPLTTEQESFGRD